MEGDGADGNGADAPGGTGGAAGAGGAVRELRGVPDTLFIPLAARVHVSRCFPDYFHDEAALSLARLIPAAVDASSSEYGHMASAARYHNLDEMTRAFAARRGRCAVVSLGAGPATRPHPCASTWTTPPPSPGRAGPGSSNSAPSSPEPANSSAGA